MTPTIAKLIALYNLLRGDKSVFVPFNMVEYFVEYCHKHKISPSGGLMNQEGQYFYID